MKTRRWVTAAAVTGSLGLLAALSACTLPGEPTPSDSAAFPTATMGSVLPDDPSTVIPEPTAASMQASITVAGADAAQATVSASGLVEGVIEDGGSCRYEFTNGTASLESTSQGIANVSTTSCGLVSIPRSSFSDGDWTVTLSYTSVSAKTVVSAPVGVDL